MKKRFSWFVLWYLRFFARLQIKKLKPLIIGVGGASGKTSLSNFLQIILKSKYSVKQGKGKNSETGIPLDILGIQMNNYTNSEWLKVMLLAPLKILIDWRKYAVYIAEMGIDSPLEPKNMSYLLKIVTPEIGVLTNISLEHSVYFEPLIEARDDVVRKEEILNLTAQQEGLLLTAVPLNGTAVLNIDDSNIEKLKPEITARVLTVSRRDKTAEFLH